MTARRSVVLGCGSYLPSHVMTNADLALVAPGISPSVNVESLGAGKGYCLDSTNGGKTAWYIGGAPGAAAGANALSTVTTGATCATLVGLTTP